MNSDDFLKLDNNRVEFKGGNMKYHPASRNDKDLKEALWEVYDGRCAYCGEKVSLKGMEIDHIIPSKPDIQSDKVKEFVKQLEEEGFVYDCIENFVPIHPIENKEKNNTTWQIERLYLSLKKSEELISKVIKTFERIKNLKKSNKCLPKLRKFIDGDSRLAEECFDYVLNESDFEDEETVYEDNEYFRYKRSIKRIAIYAHIPKEFDKELNCLIELRSLKVRDCMITLSQEDILNVLFAGIRIKDFRKRKFYVYHDYKNNDICFIQLGNCRLPITTDELSELCTVIDAFYDKYISLTKNVENIIGCRQFIYSSDVKGYKIMSIETKTWIKMIDYANKHDWENGDRKSNIFIKNWNNIYISLDGGSSINAILTPLHHNGLTDIYWKAGYGYNFTNGLEAYNEREKWKVDYTHSWIIREFIPIVLFEEYKNNHFFSVFISYEKFIKDKLKIPYINMGLHLIDDIHRIKEKEELNNYIQVLLNYVNIEDEHIFMETNILESLMNFAKMILILVKDIGISSITEYFDVELSELEIIIADISRYMVSGEEGTLIRKYYLYRLFCFFNYILYNTKVRLHEGEINLLINEIILFDKFIRERIIRLKYSDLFY